MAVAACGVISREVENSHVSGPGAYEMMMQVLRGLQVTLLGLRFSTGTGT